jgi:hypothetical protein
MPQTTYTYSLANDFPGGLINVQKLELAIQYSTIVTPLIGINTDGDVVQIIFSDALSGADKTTLDGNQSHPAGGLIASTSTTPFVSGVEGMLLIGSLKGASMSTTSDQPIYFTSTKFVVRRIIALNASGTILLATGGIYSGKNKTGNAIVSALQTFTGLTNANKFVDLTLGSVLGTDVQTSQLLYLSLTTAMLTPATCDILVFGDDLSGL